MVSGTATIWSASWVTSSSHPCQFRPSTRYPQRVKFSINHGTECEECHDERVLRKLVKVGTKSHAESGRKIKQRERESRKWKVESYFFYFNTLGHSRQQTSDIHQDRPLADQHQHHHHRCHRCHRRRLSSPDQRVNGQQVNTSTSQWFIETRAESNILKAILVTDGSEPRHCPLSIVTGQLSTCCRLSWIEFTYRRCCVGFGNSFPFLSAWKAGSSSIVKRAIGNLFHDTRSHKFRQMFNYDAIYYCSDRAIDWNTSHMARRSGFIVSTRLVSWSAKKTLSGQRL